MIIGITTEALLQIVVVTYVAGLATPYIIGSFLRLRGRC